MNQYLKNTIVSVFALLMLYSTLSPVALAYPPTHSSTALGSIYHLLSDEVTADTYAAQNVTFYSAIGGYAPYNYYGSLTMADNIYYAAEGRVAVNLWLFTSAKPTTIMCYMEYSGINSGLSVTIVETESGTRTFFHIP